MSGELYAVNYGKELQGVVPQIVDEYRAGKTLNQLVVEFKIVDYFNLTPNKAKSARSIVYFALVGNQHSQLGELYDGLLNPEEAKEIGAKHKHDGQVANGFRLKKGNQGIFGMSREEKTAVSSKVGTAMKKEGKGIFGLTKKDKISIGQATAADRGYVIHSDDEIILAYLLLDVPQLRYSNGRKKLGEMAELINRSIYDRNPVRTTDSLRSLWRRKEDVINNASEEEKARVKAQYLDDYLEDS